MWARLLILAVLVLAAWWWIQARRLQGGRPRGGAPAAPPPHEPMVACAHCGVHLPRSEAVLQDAVAYCSTAHRLDHQKQRQEAP